MSTLSAAVLILTFAARPTAAERGKAAYERDDYEEAAAAFAEAYEKDPKPGYLINRAHAERKAGNCETAVELYDAFLETDPEPDWVEVAEAARQECADAIEPDPPPPPVVAPAPVVDEPPKDEPPRRRWQRDPVGWGLFGSGLAVGIVGAGLIGGGVATDRRASSAPDEGAFETGVSRSVGLHRAGIAVASVGAALLIGGIIRWAVVAKRGSTGTGS